MSDNTAKALIMFSGGQDSATCLAWALARFDYVETVGFNYEQRHSIEMSCRQTVLDTMRAAFPDWAEKLGEDHIVDLSALGAISETSLTRDMEITLSEEGLPNSFVPGRNLIFLNFAAALGYRRGITALIGGMCEADFSGYPDCRIETLTAQIRAISLGMDKEFTLETPLMHLSKAGAWDLAYKLGGQKLVEIILEDTHTCSACDLREQGWVKYSSGQFNR